ncbi:hypothetical protein DDZ18_09715 [Marinicauda salina]|uniref:ATP-grasp domain-containing protein n=1 Tax=Marinicauda salina TaxID=2135793 RepID=A0A2U2BSH5_9PROT|nr:hypothetical protein [Marinicauda salina]PWE16975.1 hypothetical protein DDZ18_09715 [Marinicauda salina]
MTATAWWRDFEVRDGAMRVRKTGVTLPLGPGLAAEFLNWLIYHLRIEAARRDVRADGPRVWFAPDRPRPWYLVWPVVQLAGLRLADSPADADLAFFFEDATTGAPPEPAGLRVLNGGCGDVSKSHVAAVFESVSGRRLALDPGRARGPVVEKSEINGAHDGRIVTAPLAPRPERVYQRLVDAVADDGCVEDLRCPTIGGEIPLVFMKRRPAERRFENANTEVRLLETQAVFSPDEIAFLKRFLAAMRLDWGGVDVLRDRRDGALWIVDVNKTDMGPPIALPLRDKMTATRRLARALRGYADRLAAGDSA